MVKGYGWESEGQGSNPDNCSNLLITLDFRDLALVRARP